MGSYPARVVLMDKAPGHPAIDSLWAALASGVLRARDVPTSLCFGTAVFIGAEYATTHPIATHTHTHTRTHAHTSKTLNHRGLLYLRVLLRANFLEVAGWCVNPSLPRTVVFVC
jgi:hypothetical protein